MSGRSCFGPLSTDTRSLQISAVICQGLFQTMKVMRFKGKISLFEAEGVPELKLNS